MNEEENNEKLSAMPQHIGFIMDGNGRWAKERNKPRNFGHERGSNRVVDVAEWCYNRGIKCISLYAFSVENWSRSQEEVNGIFRLLGLFIKNYKKKFLEKGLRAHISGDYHMLPKTLVKAIDDLLESTKNMDKLIVNICLNYGSKQEILRAVNSILKQGKSSVDEADFEKELYTDGLPNLDLIVRTSGEQRLSNFMLYQSAYSELYFTPCYWPDFDEQELDKALAEFARRNRRFGKA